jgi:hypothetical protein
MSSVAATGCCPPFDPATFHEKEVIWKDEPFVRERVHNVFHVPVDLARKVTKAMRVIEAAHATSTTTNIMLSDELSPWLSDLYINVNAANPIEGANVVKLSGTFLTRVYEGPFHDTSKWCTDMEAYVRAQGRKLRKMYFGYTTCPRCAKAYGKNFVVLFAEVEP